MSIQVRNNHYFNEDYLSELRFASFRFILLRILNNSYKSVAEIGKGSGILAALLKNSNIKVTTIDYAEDLKPDILCDVRELHTVKKVFDCVICSQVLEHLPFQDFEKAVSSLISISRKAVIITIPDRKYYIGWSLKFPGIKEKRMRIDFPFPLKKWKPLDNPEHLWEMNQRPFLEAEICKKLQAVCEEVSGISLFEHGRVKANPSSHYFVLNRKER